MDVLPAKSWVISACLSEVDAVCIEITSWLLEQDLSEHWFPVELLTREALNNAIIHGSNLNPVHRIHCELQRSEGTLRLTVRDDGPGFDWRKCIQKEIVDDDCENGRGIQLYRLYADSIEFNSCGNQVVLVRLLDAKDDKHGIIDGT
jgi:serine/threonine-protein kinase RsbW